MDIACTSDERVAFDKAEATILELITRMEGDGDYGPEWARRARVVIQDIQDAVYFGLLRGDYRYSSCQK